MFSTFFWLLLASNLSSFSCCFLNFANLSSFSACFLAQSLDSLSSILALASLFHPCSNHHVVTVAVHISVSLFFCLYFCIFISVSVCLCLYNRVSISVPLFLCLYFCVFFSDCILYLCLYISCRISVFIFSSLYACICVCLYVWVCDLLLLVAYCVILQYLLL